VGYDAGFLGLELPLPASPTPVADVAALDYTHFSVILHRRRRLAELTAVCIDGSALVDVPRSDEWRLDPRVSPTEQAGPELYASNPLDRGHLVRRRDPVWGPDADEANLDTFTYPNAAPQVNAFNQSKELWVGLEDHVLSFADTSDLRVSVFTGPVFADDDQRYRGVQIPRRFWKIAAWSSAGSLACAAFLLDQGELLDALDLPSALPSDTPPDLGPFRTFQLAVSQLTTLTGLGFAQLEAADRFTPRPGLRVEDWSPLASPADIRL
jgi:endonuclease G